MLAMTALTLAASLRYCPARWRMTSGVMRICPAMSGSFLSALRALPAGHLLAIVSNRLSAANYLSIKGPQKPRAKALRTLRAVPSSCNPCLGAVHPVPPSLSRPYPSTASSARAADARLAGMPESDRAKAASRSTARSKMRSMSCADASLTSTTFLKYEARSCW